MKKIRLFAGALFLTTSLFLKAPVQFVKADVFEDVVITYNNVANQVEMLVAQEIENIRERRSAAERLNCLIMIERYKIKLLYLDDELERQDYSEYNKKYYDLFKLLNDWKYGR